MVPKLISIILPIYNAEDYLDKCLLSILNQTYRNFELIIINDGSTDNSFFKISKYKDKRIRIINQENKGVSFSRNVGIINSKGDYIYFIDSDDWIEPNLLETCIKEVHNNSVDLLLFGYYIHTKQDGVTISTNKMNFRNLSIKYKNNIDFFLEEKNIGMMGYVWNKLYKKSIILSNKLLFDTNMSLYEDVVFNFKYLTKVANIKALEKILYHHSNNDSESLSKRYIVNEFTMSKKMFMEIEKFLIYWGAKEPEINKALSKVIIKSIKHNIHTVIKYNNSNFYNKSSIISKIINDPIARKYIKYYKSKSFRDCFYFTLIKYKATRLIMFFLNLTK